MSKQPISSEAAFPSQPVSGELLMPGETNRARSLQIQKEWLKILARWLDDVFVVPGSNWRFGLDPIIGLIPIVGDLATTLISLYIIATAAKMQVPKSTIARMGLNIMIDSIVGAIPFVGNIFDFAWKANAKNAQLLEPRQLNSRRTKKARPLGSPPRRRPHPHRPHRHRRLINLHLLAPRLAHQPHPRLVVGTLRVPSCQPLSPHLHSTPPKARLTTRPFPFVPFVTFCSYLLFSRSTLCGLCSPSRSLR